MKRKKIVGVSFVLMIAIGVGVWAYKTPSIEEPVALTTSVVVGNIEDVVTATGIVNPKDYVDVGAQVSGQLKILHVKVGDQVKEGDLLAEIDTTVYKAKVDASRAQLKYQKAQLKSKESDVHLAKIAFTRQKNLLERSATSLEAFQNAEASLFSAEANFEMTKAQIEQIESTLKADEANLNYARIYAPMSGTVVTITARQGQTLNTNQQAPVILRIADLSTMTIQASVSEADVTKLRLNMEVYFKTLGNETKWHSKLYKVEPTPTTTNNVVLYNALFDVENHDAKLMTSMTTQVFFVKASAQDALLVPMSALAVKARTRPNTPRAEGMQRGSRQKAEGASVPREGFKRKGVVLVVLEDGTTQEREVEIGVTNRIQAQIVSGLSEGEVIVSTYITKAQETKNTQNKTALGQANTNPMPPQNAPRAR